MADIGDELAKLQKMRDHGRLTPQQFEEQRAALMNAERNPTPAPAAPNLPDFPDFAPGEVRGAAAAGFPHQPPRQTSNKTLFIILGVVGGVILLLIIVAAIAGSSHRRTQPYYGAPHYNTGPRYYSSPYYSPPPRPRPYSSRRRTYRH